jgi:hypothetical protein
MSKLHVFHNGTNTSEDQHCSDTAQTRCDSDFVKQSIMRFGAAFRELEWRDRLSLIFATVLGLALVLILSPILLVSWVCLLLARISRPSKPALKTSQP